MIYLNFRGDICKKYNFFFKFVIFQLSYDQDNFWKMLIEWPVGKCLPFKFFDDDFKILST